MLLNITSESGNLTSNETLVIKDILQNIADSAKNIEIKVFLSILGQLKVSFIYSFALSMSDTLTSTVADNYWRNGKSKLIYVHYY